MGSRVSVEYYDDLDDTVEATHLGVTIMYKGKPREIDLGEENYRRYQEFIEPYGKASRAPEDGRRQVAAAVTKRRPAAQSKKEIELDEAARRKVIRDWANRNGYSVGDKGVIPDAAVTDYELNGGLDKSESAVVTVLYNDLGPDDQKTLQKWVKDRGYPWPWKSRAMKDQIALRCWPSRDEAALAEILGDAERSSSEGQLALAQVEQSG